VFGKRPTASELATPPGVERFEAADLRPTAGSIRNRKGETVAADSGTRRDRDLRATGTTRVRLPQLHGMQGQCETRCNRRARRTQCHSAKTLGNADPSCDGTRREGVVPRRRRDRACRL
jgi:hypothetical protein